MSFSFVKLHEFRASVENLSLQVHEQARGMGLSTLISHHLNETLRHFQKASDVLLLKDETLDVSMPDIQLMEEKISECRKVLERFHLAKPKDALCISRELFVSVVSLQRQASILSMVANNSHVVSLVAPEHLFGVDDRLYDLKRELFSIKLPIRYVSVHGESGSGKTAFALNLAWNMREEFGNRILYVPIPSWNTEMDQISGAMGNLLDSLGIQPEQSVKLLTEQFADVFQNSKQIVVIDDFTSIEIFHAFIDPIVSLESTETLVIAASRLALTEDMGFTGLIEVGMDKISSSVSCNIIQRECLHWIKRGKLDTERATELVKKISEIKTAENPIVACATAGVIIDSLSCDDEPTEIESKLTGLVDKLEKVPARSDGPGEFLQNVLGSSVKWALYVLSFFPSAFNPSLIMRVCSKMEGRSEEEARFLKYVTKGDFQKDMGLLENCGLLDPAIPSLSLSQKNKKFEFIKNLVGERAVDSMMEIVMKYTSSESSGLCTCMEEEETDESEDADEGISSAEFCSGDAFQIFERVSPLVRTIYSSEFSREFPSLRSKIVEGIGKEIQATMQRMHKAFFQKKDRDFFEQSHQCQMYILQGFLFACWGLTSRNFTNDEALEHAYITRTALEYVAPYEFASEVFDSAFQEPPSAHHSWARMRRVLGVMTAWVRILTRHGRISLAREFMNQLKRVVDSYFLMSEKKRSEGGYQKDEETFLDYCAHMSEASECFLLLDKVEDGEELFKRIMKDFKAFTSTSIFEWSTPIKTSHAMRTRWQILATFATLTYKKNDAENGPKILCDLLFSGMEIWGKGHPLVIKIGEMLANMFYRSPQLSGSDTLFLGLAGCTMPDSDAQDASCSTQWMKMCVKYCVRFLMSQFVKGLDPPLVRLCEDLFKASFRVLGSSSDVTRQLCSLYLQRIVNTVPGKRILAGDRAIERRGGLYVPLDVRDVILSVMRSSKIISDQLRSEKCYREAALVRGEHVAACKSMLGSVHNGTLESMGHYTVQLSEADRREEALRVSQDLIDANLRTYGEGSVEVLGARQEYASILNLLCRFQDALEVLRTTWRQCVYYIGPHEPRTRDVHEKYILVLRQLGKHMLAKRVTGLLWSGYLTKRGKNRKSWKKRWFELGNRYLRYYPDENGELLREIDLLGSTEVEAVDEVDGSWEWIFKVHGSDRVFVFSAASEIERTEWVKMIRFVIGFVHRA